MSCECLTPRAISSHFFIAPMHSSHRVPYVCHTSSDLNPFRSLAILVHSRMGLIVLRTVRTVFGKLIVTRLTDTHPGREGQDRLDRATTPEQIVCRS